MSYDDFIAAEQDHLGLACVGRDRGWREWVDAKGHEWAAEWDEEGVRVIDVTLARKVVG